MTADGPGAKIEGGHRPPLQQRCYSDMLLTRRREPDVIGVAIQLALDCFVALLLAMTGRERGEIEGVPFANSCDRSG